LITVECSLPGHGKRPGSILRTRLHFQNRHSLHLWPPGYGPDLHQNSAALVARGCKFEIGTLCTSGHGSTGWDSTRNLKHLRHGAKKSKVGILPNLWALGHRSDLPKEPAVGVCGSLPQKTPDAQRNFFSILAPSNNNASTKVDWMQMLPSPALSEPI